jgi:CubicO group peptidase (beta-lactamase class C family)
VPTSDSITTNTTKMDLETLSSIFNPQSLIEAGVPTASIALLSAKTGTLSTHVITTGSEDKETLYQACSISKAITALAVAKLIDQGQLTYSAKIVDHLPQDIAELVVDSATKDLFPLLTVSHLLSHTSGLSQHGFPGYDIRDGGGPTAVEILAGKPPANTHKVHFTTFPGAQFSYSGGGFTVLQLFLEALLSKPFTTIMQETVLEPLGMTRSFFGPLPRNETNYAAPYLTGYLKAPSGPHRFVELAAAGLWTTPSDLVKAISAVQASLGPPQGGFLTNATAQQMLQPICVAHGATSIAQGWFVTDTTFGHSGGNEPGYGCYAVGFLPNDSNAASTELDANPCGSALATMTNGPYTNRCVEWVDSAIFYIQGWPRLATLAGGMIDQKWPAVPAPLGTEIDASWKDWIGDWEDGWKISDADGQPVIQFRELAALKLIVAAAPVQLPESGRRVIALVITGLGVQVILMWKSDERVVRLDQRESKTLTRIVS